MLFVLISSADTVVMDGPEDLDSAVIRIILADSDAVYRLGILQLLASEIDMRVVAQTNTVQGVHRALERFFSSLLERLARAEGKSKGGTRKHSLAQPWGFPASF